MLRPLLATPQIAVGDYVCAGHDSRQDERVEMFELIFTRRGLFRVESDGGSALADPSTLVVLEPGQRFRVHHPRDCHDLCFVVSIAPELFDELSAGSAAPGAPRGRRLASTSQPCSLGLFAAQRRLRARVRALLSDELAATDAALTFAADLVRALVAAAPRRIAPAPGARDPRLERVRERLAAEFEQRARLDQLAADVGMSAYQLARRFRAATGGSLHQHRLDLRLRAAVERLAEGERDLTTLALDLGFADHAHFTNSFRRRFGVPPSSFRAAHGAA